MVGVNHKEAKKRLQEVIIDSKAKSLRAFALSINIDPSLLAKVVGDQRILTPAIVKAITEKYKVNEDWLLYGKGEKYGQNGTNKPAQTSATLLTGAHVTLQDYIDDLKRDKATLYALANSILDQIKLDTKTALAYQMAWVEYEAERAAKGDEQLKRELIHRMNTLVRGYLPGQTSVHSETESGKQSKG